MINLPLIRELGYQIRSFILRRQKFVQWFLISIMAATVASILIWGLGFPLIVNADESLSSQTRFLSFADFPRPLFFFSLIYWATNTCGPEFYSCVKVLNTALYSIQSFFIFLTARFFLNKTTSLFIALLFLISPLNFYTTMFMQEPLFGALFWLVTWLLIARKFKVGLVKSTRVYAALMVVLFLAMFFTKVSAIFMLLPISFFFATSINRQSRTVGFLFFSFLAVSIVSVLLVNSIIFGEATLFGKNYGVKLSKALEIISTDSSTTVSSIFYNAFYIGAGHVIGLVILFSLPLAVLIAKAIPYLGSPSRFLNLSHDEFFEFFILFSLIFMVGAITAFSVIATITGESLLRVHMRYYNFLFPAFFIFPFIKQIRLPKTLTVMTGIVMAILAVELFLRFDHHNAGLIDAPLLRSIVKSLPDGIFILILLIQILILTISFKKKQKAIHVWRQFYFPLIVLIGLAASVVDSTRFRVFTKEQHIGESVGAILDKNELANSYFLAENLSKSLRMVFYSNSLAKTLSLNSASIQIPAKTLSLNSASNQIPEVILQKASYLVIPNEFVLVAPANASVVQYPGYQLWSLRPSKIDLDFGNSLLYQDYEFDEISPSPSGRRLVSNRIRLKLSNVRSDFNKLKISLNVINRSQAEVVLQINGQQLRFQASNAMKTFVFDIDYENLSTIELFTGSETQISIKNISLSSSK